MNPSWFYPLWFPSQIREQRGLIWGFLLSRVRGVLGGISSIPLVLAIFGGPNLGYGVPMRCFYYPQSLVWIRGANQEIGVGFGGVDPRRVVHPEQPRRDQSDQCSWPVWPVQALCDIFLGWTSWCVPCYRMLLLVSSYQVSRSLARLCVWFSSLAVWVLEVVFVLGPREVIVASWNVFCVVVLATDPIHWSDQCHQSDRRKPSV
jgi:hypothetical protein